MWIAYLVVIHLLAIIGVYFALCLCWIFVIATMTDVLDGGTTQFGRTAAWVAGSAISAAIAVGVAWYVDHRIMRTEIDKQWRLYVQAKNAADLWHCKFDLIDPIRAEAEVPLSDECKEVLFGKDRK